MISDPAFLFEFSLILVVFEFYNSLLQFWVLKNSLNDFTWRECNGPCTLYHSFDPIFGGESLPFLILNDSFSMILTAFELPFVPKAVIWPYFLAFSVIHHVLKISLIKFSKLKIRFLVVFFKLKHPIFEISQLKGTK